MVSQLDCVNKLLELGKGDPGRLEHIKQTIENNKELFISDKEYLQKLTDQYLESFLNNPENKEQPDFSLNSFCGKCGNMIKGEKFCPKCGTAQDKQTESFCGRCGSKIYGDNPCPKCNAQDNQPRNQAQNKFGQRPLEWKSESTALILTIVLGIFGLGGIGHIYLGKTARGITILIVGIILLIISVATLGIGLFALIPFAIWVVFDTRTQCKYYNDYLEQYGRAPW